MLDMAWSSAITKDPIVLADAIELTVAFSEEDCNGSFTLAHFQRFVASENLSDDDQSYLTGDEADERNEQFEQAVTLIRNRASWLGGAYPFSVESNEVRFSPQPSVSKFLPYLFLLVCSNGNFVPSLRSALPTEFEDLCKEAFRALFPNWAEVVSFSQKSQDRKAIFGLPANEAVPKLANKLNTAPINVESLPKTQREFGIDIIAICSLGDQAAYPLFAFAQCTIQQEWWSKRHEAIAQTELTGFITLNARHSNFLMIPYFPRYKLEEWSEDPARTGNCIICDRFRLCVLLEKSEFFEYDKPPATVAPIFKTLRENLVQSV